MSTSRTARPDDLMLMLLRASMLLVAAIALAGPVRTSGRDESLQIVLADVSGSVDEIAEVRDSAVGVANAGDVVIAFDTTASSLVAADSIVRRGSEAPGSLSVALVAGIRAAAARSRDADSLALAIISPFSAEEMDAATDSIRTLWPGGIRLIPVRARRGTSARVRMTFSAAADDPLLATASLAGNSAGVHVDRGGAATSNSSLHWPISGRPRYAVRATPDTVMGVRTDGAVVIAAFPRTWIFPRDSLLGAAVIARWIDGAPAVIEKSTPTGCTRSSAVLVESAGDLAIRAEFMAFFRAISSRCGTVPVSAAAPAASLAALRGGTAMAPSGRFNDPSHVSSPHTPWLIGLAISLALMELLVRRRGRAGTTPARDTATSSKAA